MSAVRRASLLLALVAALATLIGWVPGSVAADATGPSVVLTAPAGPVKGDFTVTVTFSEPVTDFVPSDLIVGNGIYWNLNGAGPDYTFTVTPAADGLVTVDLPADAAHDADGDGNTAAAQLVRTADVTRPGVVLSAPVGTVGGPFVVTATFSEPVTGMAAGDFTIGNGTASDLTGAGNGPETNYTITVAPSADGAVTVDLPANTVQDASGNFNTAAVQLTRTADSTRPTVTLTSAPGPFRNPFVVTATFSEPVTGFAAGDFTVGNGTGMLLGGSGATYTILVMLAADGAVTVDLPAGGVQDAAGNTNTAATRLSRTTDTTRPTVALTSAAGPVNGAFTVTATFSESVSGVALGDVTVGNGTASDLAGSGTTYTLTVTPAAGGAVTVDLPANTAQDAAGNGNTAANQLTRTADLARPSAVLTSTANDPVNGPFTVTATFSETVTGLVLGDFTTTNGTLSDLAGSGTIYMITVTPAGAGVVTIDLPAGVASDSAGNGNTAATSLSRTVEPPRDLDVTRPSAALTSSDGPVNGAFDVTVTFSEPVIGLTLGDFTASNGTLSDLSGSGTTFTLRVAPSADGTVTVDLLANTVQDAAGNSNTAAGQLIRTADLTRPTVDLNAPPGPVNGSFTVTATFSEPVTGLVAGDFTAVNGTLSAFSGSGTTYTITITPRADGPVTIGLPAGGASDAAGNTQVDAAELSRTADVTRPTVVLRAPTGRVDGAFTVTAAFSEAVTGLTLDDFVVGNGAATGLAGSGTTYSLTVTPTAAGRVTINLPGAAVQDAAGNSNAAAARLVRIAKPSECTITGTPGDDVLRGTSGGDVICGRGGDDRIYGGAGDDTLRGGTGDDRINGGTGADTIEGGPGDDRIIGGPGRDTVRRASAEDPITRPGQRSTRDGRVLRISQGRASRNAG